MVYEISLMADGEDVSRAIAPLILSLSVTDDVEDTSDRLTLSLDWLAGLKIPRRGVILKLAVGGIDLGQFVVDRVSGSEVARTLEIEASATPLNTAQGKNPHTPMHSQRTRTWPANSTLGSIGKTIASEASLTLAIPPTLAGFIFSNIAQRQESNLHLLTRLAKQANAYVKLNGGSLILQPTNASTTASGKALPTHAIPRTHRDELTFDSGGRGETNTVKARYRRKGQAHATTIQVGGTGVVQELKPVYASEAEARQAAQAELARKKSASTTVRCDLAIPDFSIFALHRVVFEGADAVFAGQWKVKQRVHTLMAGMGWKTSLQCEKL